MDPYSSSRLARVMHEERVREALGRDSAGDNGGPRGSDSRKLSEQRDVRPRFQAAVRWLVVGLFLS